MSLAEKLAMSAGIGSPLQTSLGPVENDAPGGPSVRAVTLGYQINDRAIKCACGMDAYYCHSLTRKMPDKDGRETKMRLRYFCLTCKVCFVVTIELTTNATPPEGM